MGESTGDTSTSRVGEDRQAVLEARAAELTRELALEEHDGDDDEQAATDNGEGGDGQSNAAGSGSPGQFSMEES